VRWMIKNFHKIYCVMNDCNFPWDLLCGEWLTEINDEKNIVRWMMNERW